MTMVAVVGCASQKLDRPAKARDLYVSQLFKKASAYAEQQAEHWFILSAKHGLVHPDTVLEPYNVKLGDAKTGPPIHDWSDRVRAGLCKFEEDSQIADMEILVLAGEQYRTPFLTFGHAPCPWPVHVPMRGLCIGEQLRFLTERLAA